MGSESLPRQIGRDQISDVSIDHPAASPGALYVQYGRICVVLPQGPSTILLKLGTISCL